MAEIVGLVAAGGQFIEQGSKIIKVLIKFDAKLDGTETKEWLEDTKTLQNLLQQIKDTPDLQTLDINKLLARCEAIQAEILASLEKVDFDPHGPKWEKANKAFQALIKDSDVVECFGKLGRLKQDLTLAIQLKDRTLLKDISSDVRELVTNTDRDKSNVTEEVRCLQDLFVTDPSCDRDAIITAKGGIVANTCDWITATDAYVSWNQSKNGLLWVHGGPGKGKTYLSVALTNILQNQHSAPQLSDRKPTVIYFFCDHRDVAKRGKAVSILRGLIYQLVQCHQNLLHLLLEPWRIQKEAIFHEGSFETLWKIFRSMLEKLHGHDIYCVIDALDECEEKSLHQLLSKLKALLTSPLAESHSTKFVLLSRRSPDILPQHLSIFPHIDLDQSGDSAAAVERYISTRLAELANLKSIDSKHPLLQHIKSTFLDRSGGTFLWVSFMVADLKAKSIADIESALEDLPVGLDKVYERILSQIPPRNSIKIASLLQWVTLAFRPLSLAELCEALHIQGTANLSRQDVCIDYVKQCGNLLLLTGKGPKETVSFVHQSAKDFLLKQQDLAAYRISGTKGHATMADRLLSWIDQEFPLHKADEDTLSPMLENPDPETPWILAPYAIDKWFQHMRLVDEDSALNLVRSHEAFFEKDSPSRRWWYRADQLYCWHSPQEIYNKLPLLHLACAFGFHHLAKYELDGAQLWIKRMANRLTHRKSYKNSIYCSTPLIFAIKEDHDNIVRLLLDYHADPNRADEIRTPLGEACATGNLDIVRALLNAGADPNREDRTGYMPLYRAVWFRDVTIIRLLLELGADVNANKLYMRDTPLCYAVRDQQLETTSLLLEFDADPNFQDGLGNTALHFACTSIPSSKRASAKDTIRLLLDHGANPSIKNKRGETAYDVLLHDPDTGGSLDRLLEWMTDSEIARLKGG